MQLRMIKQTILIKTKHDIGLSEWIKLIYYRNNLLQMIKTLTNKYMMFDRKINLQT